MTKPIGRDTIYRCRRFSAQQTNKQRDLPQHLLKMIVEAGSGIHDRVPHTGVIRPTIPGALSRSVAYGAVARLMRLSMAW